jgi:hypothetical protein
VAKSGDAKIQQPTNVHFKWKYDSIDAIPSSNNRLLTRSQV